MSAESSSNTFIPDIKSSKHNTSIECPVVTLTLDNSNFDILHLKAKAECPFFKSSQGCPFGTVSSETTINGNFTHKLIESIPKDHPKCPIDLKNASPTTVALVKQLATFRTDLFSQCESELFLANKLKKGTADIHEKAHRLQFVSHILKGKKKDFPEEIYLQLLVSFYHVYSILEESLDACSNDEILKEIYFPTELFRRDHIFQDIKFYCSILSKDINEEISIISPSTQNFMDHIKNCQKTNPKLLIGISYARYLGDLSGGQIMSKRIAKMYNLNEDLHGISFYQFPNLKMSIESFKNLYKGKLNSLQITDETLIDSIIAEAVSSFSLTIEIYKELDRILPNILKSGNKNFTLISRQSALVLSLAIGIVFVISFLKKSIH